MDDLPSPRSTASDAVPPLRASDAERDRAVDVLRDAAAQGRLNFEELSDRIETAAHSTTRGELERLTADLPVERQAAATRDVAVQTRFSSTFGDLQRAGGWTVPTDSRWKTVFGNIVLDLRAAHVIDGEVTVDVETVFGDVELLVPEGIAVEVRSRTTFGDLRQRAGTTAPGAPRVILTGRTVFGNVTVQHTRLRERLAAQLREFRKPEGR